MAMRPWDPLWEEVVSGGKRLLAAVYFQCALLLFVLFARMSDHFLGRDDGSSASLVVGDVMSRIVWFLGTGGGTGDTENEAASGELLQKEFECPACEYDNAAREENAVARGGPKRRQPAAILDVIDDIGPNGLLILPRVGEDCINNLSAKVKVLVKVVKGKSNSQVGTILVPNLLSSSRH